MVLRFHFLFAFLLLLGCVPDFERDSLNDPGSNNYYNGNTQQQSSSDGSTQLGSSSSDDESSSSSEIASEKSSSSSSDDEEENYSSSSDRELGQFDGDEFDGDEFIDSRDGKRYKFEVAPNGRVWMNENLNYSNNNTLGYCYGVDIKGEDSHRNTSGCDNGYGRTYEWTTAIDNNSPQGLCPAGWHIPSKEEWSSITNNIDMSSQCWHINMSYNFCVLAGNYGNPIYPMYSSIYAWKERNENGFYWTSSGSTYFAGLWGCNCVEVQNDDVSEEYFSIRCIMDEWK
jgi:uncharacterized protein (TIGR02145 family)